MCVCVYVYVDFVTVSAGSNRPLLCLNKLTPQPNLRQLIMWACIHSCVSMSKCFCLFMCCFIPHPLYSYTSHNMCRVIGALKLTAYQLVFVYYFFKLVDNAFCTVTQVVVYFVNAYSYWNWVLISRWNYAEKKTRESDCEVPEWGKQLF